MARKALEHQESKKQKRFSETTLQEQQIPIFGSEKKDLWVFGGNRSGKSETGAIETTIRATGIVPRALKDIYKRPIRVPSQIWVASIDFPNSRDIAQKKILRYVPGDMRKRWDERNHVLYLTNGSEIGFKSYDSGFLSFQGTDKDFIWCDEEPPRDIRQECMMRLIDRKGDFLCTMTPTQGLTWVYEEVYLNPQADPDIAIFFMTLTKNNYIPTEEKERVRAKFTKEEWRMREEGAFISKTGTIFSIDDGVNTVEPFPIPLEWSRYRVIDPGIGHPTGALWCAVEPTGRRYYYREYLVADRNVDQNAESIIKSSKYLTKEGHMISENILTTILDPHSGASRTYSSTRTVQELYQIAGIPNILCPVGKNDKDVGIDKARQALLPWPDGKSGSVFFSNLTQTLRTLRGYVWDSKRVDGMAISTGKPKKINDELPDCFQYMELYEPSWIPPEELAYSGEEIGVANPTTGW